jgi:hypothetical protein
MVLENLDRTQWSFAEALAHVETVVVAHRAVEASRLPAAPPREYMPWERPEDPRVRWKAEAREQVLVALRDGDLHAQGRFSDTRNNRNWGSDFNKEWVLHSGHHEPISPAHWRQGRFERDGLSSNQWEFIDIRVPRFMVLAIWPAYVPPSMPKSVDAPAYTTPYLALMQEAIEHFSLSEARQEKKDSLYEWFRAQEVDGELVSGNLCDAMATLIRLPGAQRGGAKRQTGPDLRRAV